MALRGSDDLVRRLNEAERFGEKSSATIARLLRTYFALLDAAPTPPVRAVTLLTSVLQERQWSWAGPTPSRTELLEIVSQSLIGAENRAYLTAILSKMEDVGLLKVLEAAYQLEKNT